MLSYSRPKKRRSGFSTLLFNMNLLVFVVCAALLAKYYYEGFLMTKQQGDLIGIMDSISGSTNQNKSDRYAGIRSQYPYLVGKLSFHNYNDIIDLPIMQTKEDYQYFLYRDINGKDSKWGTPFMDYRCDMSIPTDNFIVYAHNMKDMTQFGSLKNYKTKEYWQKYPTMEFESMYEEKCEYQVVASFYTQIYGSDVEGVFKYYTFFDAQNKEEFDSFITNIKKIQCYDTGVVPSYGDQLLTLTTCDYTQHLENGRFVVVTCKVK